MGFYHVGDRDAVMASGVFDGRVTFSFKERYHAQLAYEVGRGTEYCGWPYSTACFERSAMSAGRGYRGYIKD